MCKCLGISRSGYYAYDEENANKTKMDSIAPIVLQIFNENQKAYGTRKIQRALRKDNMFLSRNRIKRIMNFLGIESSYATTKYKSLHDKTNEAKIANVLNRAFDHRQEKEVIVSDLTYVRVGSSWHYICIIVDLFNREILAWSCGPKKDAKLVRNAFARLPGSLYDYSIFHTDRGSEFDNMLIDEILMEFNIQRSLSQKGCPYDNLVAEATFKIIKKEFVKPRCFGSLEQLEMELIAYIYWFNHKRMHSSLKYLSPVDYRYQYSH